MRIEKIYRFSAHDLGSGPESLNLPTSFYAALRTAERATISIHSGETLKFYLRFVEELDKAVNEKLLRTDQGEVFMQPLRRKLFLAFREYITALMPKHLKNRKDGTLQQIFTKYYASGLLTEMQFQLLQGELEDRMKRITSST